MVLSTLNTRYFALSSGVLIYGTKIMLLIMYGSVSNVWWARILAVPFFFSVSVKKISHICMVCLMS